MKLSKAKTIAWDKYQAKFNYIIKVLRSCKTEEQVEVVKKWAKSLILQWSHYEDWYLDHVSGDGILTRTDKSCGMNRTLGLMVDILNVEIDEKLEKLSENEEDLTDE